MNQGSAGLTPEQIDGIAREIGEMARQGRADAAYAWIRKIRRIRREGIRAAAGDPRCSACDSEPLPGKRWCSTHAPVFFRPPEYPPRPRPIDRAREAVLAAPHESAERLALRLGCSPTTIRRAWRELGIAHDRRRSA